MPGRWTKSISCVRSSSTARTPPASKHRPGLDERRPGSQRETHLIQSICLEEDAARKVETKASEVTYRLDRLGIPLIEIATGPDMHDAGGSQGRRPAHRLDTSGNEEGEARHRHYTRRLQHLDPWRGESGDQGRPGPEAPAPLRGKGGGEAASPAHDTGTS